MTLNKNIFCEFFYPTTFGITVTEITKHPNSFSYTAVSHSHSCKMGLCKCVAALNGILTLKPGLSSRLSNLITVYLSSWRENNKSKRSKEGQKATSMRIWMQQIPLPLSALLCSTGSEAGKATSVRQVHKSRQDETKCRSQPPPHPLSKHSSARVRSER